MGYQTPKLAQDTRRLRMDIENAVRRFDRFHKYSSGEDLRAQVKVVQRSITRAWNELHKGRQVLLIERLKQEIDQLKNDMQLAQDVRAFRSLRQFQHLYRQVEEIGRQAGGWYKKQHPSAQNPQGRRAVAERGQILSTHATPNGVNA